LLRLEASLARVSQSGLKTSGGATVGGARGSVEVRLRRRQVEDGRVDVTGWVRPCYPNFAVFNVLGPRSIVVI
jgi:hypothetical protein